VVECDGCPNCHNVNNGLYVCMCGIKCDLVWADGAVVYVVLCMSVDHVWNFGYGELMQY
jgi:hypothetical protein